jgi:hypothetical protein
MSRWSNGPHRRVNADEGLTSTRHRASIMVKADKIIPKPPRLIDTLARALALECAAEAAKCQDAERWRRSEVTR